MPPRSLLIGESQSCSKAGQCLTYSTSPDVAGAPVYTETGIADLNAAQEHLASSLTGGLYIQADKDMPQRLSTSDAELVKAEGGKSMPPSYGDHD
jgi:hypothetical protein